METALSIATIIPLPLVAATATILLEVLAPRSLEENVLLFQTRSQHIGSLSAVSAFLAAVQAQFISLTYEKNSGPVEKAANVCFFLGVSLNVIGATTSLMATSSLPTPAALQNNLAAYQRAIEAAEVIGAPDDPDTSHSSQSTLDQLKSWGRLHHRHITDMLVAGNLIARWNFQRFMYALVMLSGVLSFFMGLMFFIIDTQPREVWITILIASLGSFILIRGAQAVSSLGYMHFGSGSRSYLQRMFSLPEYYYEEKRSRDVMIQRQEVVAAIYKLCSDRGFV